MFLNNYINRLDVFLGRFFLDYGYQLISLFLLLFSFGVFFLYGIYSLFLFIIIIFLLSLTSIFVLKSSKAAELYLFLLIFLIPIEKIQWYLWFAIKPVIILSVFGGCYSLYAIIKNGKITKNTANILFLFFLIILSESISVINSISYIVSFRQISLYITLFALVLIILHFGEKEFWLRKMNTYFLFSGFSVVLYGYIQFIFTAFGVNTDEIIFGKISYNSAAGFNPKLISTFGFRMMSFFGDANNFAAFLSAFIPVNFVLLMKALRDRDSKKKKTYLFLFLLSLGAMILTFSRSAMLGLAVALFFGIIILYKNVFTFRIFKIISLIVLVVFLAILPFWDTFTTLVKIRFAFEGSAKTHFELMQFAYNLFLNSPLIGNGIGNFGHYYARFLEFGIHYPHSHSAYFTWLAEIGIFGFLCHMLLFFYGIIRGLLFFLKSKNEYLKYLSLGYVLGMIGVLTSNIFYLSHTFQFFYFVLAFLLCFDYHNESFSRKKV